MAGTQFQDAASVADERVLVAGDSKGVGRTMLSSGPPASR
eukprot:gene34799-18658_t